MEIVKNAELVEVTDKDGKITLTFMNEERIYEINWNRKAYDSTLNDFVENEDKEKQVEEWSKTYFGVPTKKLESKLGTKKDIYYYDTYCSLWESDVKFTKDDNGKTFKTTIDSIVETDSEISIYYYWDDRKFRSKMSFNQKVGDKYYLNPMKQRKQYKNFEKKFGVPIDKKDELIGKEIMVKVRSMYNKYFYGEVSYLG